MKVLIEHYVASNNIDGVNRMLNKYGVPTAKDTADAIQKLRYLLKSKGNEAMQELLSIATPYRDMVVAVQGTDEGKSNACGCGSGFDGENKSNCGGNSDCKCNQKSNVEGTPDATPAKMDLKKDILPLVAIGLLLVATTAVLIKKA